LLNQPTHSKGDVLDGIEVAPWGALSVDLGLGEANNSLRKSAVVGIGDTAHRALRPSFGDAVVECILQRTRERYPEARPRIISNNGAQFVAKDFKEFLRVAGMTHVRTAPYYPQLGSRSAPPAVLF